MVCRLHWRWCREAGYRIRDENDLKSNKELMT